MSLHYVALLTLLIMCTQHIREINSLRCARDCEFGPIKPGSKNPFHAPCDTIEIDPQTTECTVELIIKLSHSIIFGVLDTKPRQSNMSATLKTFLNLNLHSTNSMINYTCTINDNCDQEFVIESVSSSKGSQLNETQIRTEISSLLIDPTLDENNFTCAHNVMCQTAGYNCQADMTMTTLTSKSSIINFNNSFPCIPNYLTAIGIFYYFNSPSNFYETRTSVYCNRQNCNQRETIEQAYNIIQNQYMLPLNYSQFIPTNNFSNKLFTISYNYNYFIFYILWSLMLKMFF
ncbi:hypothetical protein I4U23_003636 [Adineta vaga]|nr:hypothetical protein I4U23_003636 [Adineta vaga]